MNILTNCFVLANFADPFTMESVVGVRTHIFKSMVGEKWYFQGSIKFKSGQTEGEQNFDCSSAEQLHAEMKAFAEQLRTKTAA